MPDVGVDQAIDLRLRAAAVFASGAPLCSLLGLRLVGGEEGTAGLVAGTARDEPGAA